MFDSLTSKFSSVFSSLRTKGRLKSGDISEIGAEIRAALLDSDVALDVADSFFAAITERSLSPRWICGLHELALSMILQS